MDDIADRAIPAEAAVTGAPSEDRRPPEPIDPAHVAVVERGMEQARCGQFTPSDAVGAVFRRAGL